MKTRLTLIIAVILGIIVFESFYNPVYKTPNEQYILVGWNDLGMHCANKDFQNMAVLPPYNNLTAQVIKRGSDTELPQLINAGVYITYEIPGNTYSVGKTNFWDYEYDLFGVNLPDNIGLTGEGLTGQMHPVDQHFAVEGIPITPYQDTNLLVEDPFQLALLKLYDVNDNLLASTQPVIPVSNEINCVSSGCHSSENDILYEHEDEGGFDPTDTPILCASCHSSNALGTPGTPGLESLSEVIHDKHKDKTNDCYKCHPGPNTQCQRGVMHDAGMVCQDCHGNLTEVAESIKEGREPWLEEPSCGSANCHGSNYAEETGKLFRQSKGHGGLYCSTCHGSPHAILPAVTERDNIQNIAIQGFEGTLRRCETCHGVVPQMPGPHGVLPPSPITTLNLKILLQGPFNGSEMETYLNAGLQLPLVQPYSVSPWNYQGSESISEIPNPDIVDWILVELRESSGDASTATQNKVISQRAGFLLKDGTIVDLDGVSSLNFPVPLYTNLYAVIWHRNHIGVMSSNALASNSGIYDYDFSTSAEMVYGGITGYKEIATGIFGMVGGDGNADGVVLIDDKEVVWGPQAGNSGYQQGDFDLNMQIDNKDKNQIWFPNLGTGIQVPDLGMIENFKCAVPD